MFVGRGRSSEVTGDGIFKDAWRYVVVVGPLSPVVRERVSVEAGFIKTGATVRGDIASGLSPLVILDRGLVERGRMSKVASVEECDVVS